MEIMDKKPLAILNLTGKLCPELEAYFISRKIKVVDPLVSDETFPWTHIITKNLNDFKIIQTTYQTLEKDIKLISLTTVSDLQSFILSNGKFILDEVWLKGPLGSFILDKFLQEYAGIALSDNYPTFKEIGSFNISNPFNTGEYLDRLVYHAFKEGMSGLSLKTFFDHLLMYLSGLKTKGKIGLPIEVTYGTYNDVFGVQLHFFTNNLMMDDVTNCLTSHITKKPEEYLLNISVQSTDFFDFTYLDQVNKAVITGLWTKDERVKFENRGLVFTNLSSAGSVSSYPTEGLSSFLTQDPNIEDMSSKIILPEKAKEEVTQITGEKFTEALADKISSSMDVEKIKEIISGNMEEAYSELIKGTGPAPEEAQLVKGATEDDVMIHLGSDKAMEDILNLVKGKFDEENKITRISGNKMDVDKFAYRIAAGLGDKVKGDGNLKMKILGEKLPESIKTGLFDFAKRLNKTIDDLDDTEMTTFKEIEIPKVIKQHAQVDNSREVFTNFASAFKEDLNEQLMSEFHADSVDELVNEIKSPEDIERVKEVMKASLKKSLDDKFKLSQKNNITDQEQNILVKALSTTLTEDENKVRKIVATEKTENEVQDVKSLFPNSSNNSEKEKKLEAQVKLLSTENMTLKTKLKTAMSEVRVMQDTRKNVEQIKQKAAEKAAEKASEAEESGLPDPDAMLRAQLIQKISDQKILSEMDVKKVASLLERESKLIDDVRKEELKAKKSQIESTQKENYFVKEIEKLTRQSKAKDLMITKTKETLIKLSERKEAELGEFRVKLDNINKSLLTGPAQSQATIIRDLEKKNANTEKMLDVYKNKITTLTALIESSKADASSKDETRKLQMINQQVRNQLDATKRELTKFQEKSNQDNVSILSLKGDKVKLEAALKKTMDATKETVAAPVQNDHELKKYQAQAQLAESHFREAAAKVKELEVKLTEVQKTQKVTSKNEEGGGVKATQLEASVKKLTQDLVESRNQLTEMKKETNKLRQEKTALQNQMDKMKKDMDKSAKAAPPKKPGTGGKAA